MTYRRRTALVSALVVGLAVASAPAAQAATVSDYSDVAATPNVEGCTIAQGFAAGPTYLYAIKTRSDDKRSVIHRVDKNTGVSTVMTTGAKTYNPWLGHANDMTTADFGGKHYLFVVTLDKTTSGVQLVQLGYTGTTYTKVRSFHVTYEGKPRGVSGIDRISTSSTGITFFFKSAKQVYRGTVRPASGSRTVKLAKAFTLSTEKALVDGAVVPDLATFANQGFHYDIAKKVLYYPLTKDNRSIVLVYRNVGRTRDTTAKPSTEDSFSITSADYPAKFEIEGVGTSGGRLYFNTNRATSQAAADGVHVFEGYSS